MFVGHEPLMKDLLRQQQGAPVGYIPNGSVLDLNTYELTLPVVPVTPPVSAVQ